MGDVMIKPSQSSTALRLVFALAIAGWVSLGARSSAGIAENTVKIENFTFDPPRLLVKPGTMVTWINEDDIPHTVTSTTKLFRSKALDTDDRFSFTFSALGVYEYFCSLHPHMKGAIVVEAEQGK
jgi:plastocyanin